MKKSLQTIIFISRIFGILKQENNFILWQYENGLNYSGILYIYQWKLLKWRVLLLAGKNNYKVKNKFVKLYIQLFNKVYCIFIKYKALGYLVEMCMVHERESLLTSLHRAHPTKPITTKIKSRQQF